jgi:Glu-tRNA(Gln) amidotransferase subunit E-like FAD-binding protein
VTVSIDRVKEANAEQLHREFGDIVFKLGETMEDFTLRINNLANQLRILDDDINDKEVIKKLLHAILEKLEQVVISIEMLLDLDNLSIEEVVGHLRAVKQQKKSTPSKENNICFPLTEGWMARMKNCDENRSNSVARRDDRNASNDKNKGGKLKLGRRKATEAGHADSCAYCGKKGHWASIQSSIKSILFLT